MFALDYYFIKLDISLILLKQASNLCMKHTSITILVYTVTISFTNENEVSTKVLLNAFLNSRSLQYKQESFNNITKK